MNTMPNGVAWRQQYIKVQDHTLQNDKRSSGACCHSVSISISKLFVVIAGSFAFSLISVQLRSHVQMKRAKGETLPCFETSPIDPGVKEPLDAIAVILTSTMHTTRLSTSSRIHRHSSDLYLCHLSFSGETKLFTSCSYLPVSLHPSTYQPMAAVIPPLLTSTWPLRCIWQDPSVAESSNSGEQTGGRTERGRNASGLSNSVSSSNSVLSNLHLFLTHAVVSSLKLYALLFLSH